MISENFTECKLAQRVRVTPERSNIVQVCNVSKSVPLLEIFIHGTNCYDGERFKASDNIYKAYMCAEQL